MLDRRTVSAIEGFVFGNVLVSLPTEFGVSLIYGLLVCSIALEDTQEHSQYCRFITPLASLMHMIEQKA